MIRIYKLKYTDRETAIADLIAKGVYQEIDGELSYSEGIHAVVEIGLLIDQEASEINASQAQLNIGTTFIIEEI